MMLRWFAICFLAFAVAKWSGNVQAEDELDDEDKLLLRALGEVMEDNDKREMSCETECQGSPIYDQCMEECVENKLVKRMEQAAQKQEDTNKEVDGQKQKRWWWPWRKHYNRVPSRTPWTRRRRH